MNCIPGTPCFVNAVTAWAADENRRTVAHLLAVVRSLFHLRGIWIP